MTLRKLLGVWFKYQLSLNWLNILFKYCVKVLLFLNVVVVVVGITYKFKIAISQFPYLIAAIALADLVLKSQFRKKRQDIPAFRVVPKGVFFLSTLNILQDVFSPRNLILPLLTIIMVATLGETASPSYLYLLVIAGLNNVVAGFIKKSLQVIGLVIMAALILASFCYQASTELTVAFSISIFLLSVYIRYEEKTYPEENTSPRATNSIDDIGNRFLWLDFQILKKSKHLQIAFVKVIGICFLYCYIISIRRTSHEIGVDTILLIQIYYSLAPILLIPYILSANYSHIALLMTVPDLKVFFITKLNILLLIQLLLTVVLAALNYNNVQALFLISSIFIFNIFIITPILFMGILLTDEKVNIFNGGINNFLFVPPFIQSVFFLVVLVSTAVVLYLFYYLGLNIFSWTLIALSSLAFTQRQRFLRFFHSKYHDKKYKLYNKLS